MEDMKAFAQGYVTLPIEKYDELMRNDIRSHIKISKPSTSDWSLGNIDMGIPVWVVEQLVEAHKDEIDPEAKINVTYCATTIAKVPKDIMLQRLHRDEEDEDA